MKKSQVSIYVIAGLLLVILVGSAYYYSLSVNMENINGGGNFPQISQDFLSKTIQDCIHTSLLDTINQYGLCKTEDRIKEALMKSLPKCMDFTRFREQDYEVTAAEKPESVDAEIRENEVFVKLVFPIKLEKGDEVFTFYEKEYILPRTTSMRLEYNLDSKTTKDNVLVSSDTDAELAIFKGTKVTVNSHNVQNISVYMKEMCPDDPSVVGKVKYQFMPENIKFEPDAFLTIRYLQQDVSKLAKEESFKIAYLDGNHWEPVVSSDNFERDRVRTSIDHLSEWTASCDLTNKYGSQVMLQDLYASDPGAADTFTDRDLRCAANFSGDCGYAKLVVYLRIDNYLDLYTKAINKMYEQHLIPVLTFKETPPKTNWEGIWYYKHPGMCESDLDCKYGENEDGTGKPSYDYSVDFSRAVTLLDAVHKDKPQWPMYVEMWEEPNLASEWGDISLTQYQAEEYIKYFKKMGEAIKELPHAESIKIMQAGLAPTEGMKRCMLTPKFDKQYDASPEDAPIEETKVGNAYMAVGDCKSLKYLPDYYSGSTNYCDPHVDAPMEPVIDCQTLVCTVGVAGCTGNEVEQCCTSQKNHIKSANSWRRYYIGHMPNLYDDPLYDEPAEECTPENVELANNILERTQDIVGTYCFEKITEINTNEYLSKIFAGGSSGPLCQNIDVYADHSYPENEGLDTFPGGQDPFGMDAYKSRFNIVKQRCSELATFNCISANNEDTDSDQIKDISDNCPYVANTEQIDWDGDGYGDVCDDSDKDDAVDSEDLCALDATVQTGTDSDTDGWADVCDNCPDLSNHDQRNQDLDTLGDACDANTDNDAIPEIGFDTKCVVNTEHNTVADCVDNCRYKPNGPDLGTCLGETDKTCAIDSECQENKCQKNQEDEDGDGYGDVCDNCVNYPNPTQADFNRDGAGDACQDTDGDGFKDNIDFCPTTPTTENLPEACTADNLCLGKVFITETAWAPHVDIYPLNLEHEFDFNVDDYVSQMSQAYGRWTNDDNVISIIPFHIGEDDALVRKELRNYAWTTKVCADTCVGKNIFNTIGKIQNPVTQCSGGGTIPGGGCVNSKFIYQNLKAEVGAKTHQYTCMKCNSQGTLDSPGSSSMSVALVNGMTVKFQGLDECFESKDFELPAGAGGCPEVIGSDTNDGYTPTSMVINGTTYYGWAVCVPDAALQSSKAWFHACGSESDCNLNPQNCLTNGGTYGNWWVSCVPNGNGTCSGDSECTGNMVCDPTKRACVECSTDSQCTNETRPVCDQDSNICIAACDANDDCTDETKPVCDISSKKCVACLSDSECTDDAIPVCDTANKLCVECLADADCTEASKPVCNTALRICIADTTPECTSDSECTDPEKPACDIANGLCEECTADSDCTDTAKPVCDLAEKACIAEPEPPCTANADCTDPTKPVCDIPNGLCVTCIANADCTDPAKAICNTADKQCVECLTDAGCTDPTKPVCDIPDGICGECNANADCTDQTKAICDTEDNQCVQCMADTDCALASKPVCNTDTNLCEALQLGTFP